MPLLTMPHPDNDGGYAIEDFDTVDPSIDQSGPRRLTAKLQGRHQPVLLISS